MLWFDFWHGTMEREFKSWEIAIYILLHMPLLCDFSPWIAFFLVSSFSLRNNDWLMENKVCQASSAETLMNEIMETPTTVSEDYQQMSGQDLILYVLLEL